MFSLLYLYVLCFFIRIYLWLGVCSMLLFIYVECSSQYSHNINIRTKHDVLVHEEQFSVRVFFIYCDTFVFIVLLICMWFIHFCLCSASSGADTERLSDYIAESLPWTIVANVLGEWHAICRLNVLFIDFEKTFFVLDIAEIQLAGC
jgi:hypothetical protein